MTVSQYLQQLVSEAKAELGAFIRSPESMLTLSEHRAPVSSMRHTSGQLTAPGKATTLLYATHRMNDLQNVRAHDLSIPLHHLVTEYVLWQSWISVLSPGADQSAVFIQHWLPSCYLRGFGKPQKDKGKTSLTFKQTDVDVHGDITGFTPVADKELFVNPVKANKALRYAAHVENFFSHMESSFAQSAKALREGDDSRWHKIVVAGFFMVQATRTPPTTAPKLSTWKKRFPEIGKGLMLDHVFSVLADMNFTEMYVVKTSEVFPLVPFIPVAYRHTVEGARVLAFPLSQDYAVVLSDWKFSRPRVRDIVSSAILASKKRAGRFETPVFVKQVFSDF